MNFQPDMTPITIIFGLAATYIIAFIIRHFCRFQIWSGQGIPQLSPWLYHWRFVTTASFSGLDFGQSTMDNIKKMGTIYGSNDLLRMCLYVADADALKDIIVRDFHHFMRKRDWMNSAILTRKFLLQMNDQEWKQTRQIMSPTFSSGKMKSMFPLMKQSMESLMDVFAKNSDQDLDVLTTFGNFTMDVIARTAFAVTTNGHDNPDDPFIYHGRKVFDYAVWKILAYVTLPKFACDFIELNIFDDDSFDFLAKLAQQMMRQRKESDLNGNGKKFHDFLDLMLAAGEDDGNGNRKTLTDVEIVSNIILVLAAGYHTTSLTLTHASYMLATHPDIQEKVRQEVLQVMEQNGGILDYEVLNSLTYLEAVINETLRMCPPLVHVERECSKDYILKVNTSTLGCRDIRIPEGAGIEIPIYAIHHMEEYYPEPEVFRPERFLPENKDNLVPYTFLAFVAGPRNCLGMRFAILELKMALGHILSRFQISTSPKTSIPIQYKKAAAILLQPTEVILRLTQRD